VVAASRCDLAREGGCSPTENRNLHDNVGFNFHLMKTLTLITVGLLVAASAQAAPRRVLTRISDETGVPVATLQAQRTATGFGYGEIEKANLLANASGQSFDTIAAKHQAGEGWGKIAHDYGFKLGDLVSGANKSDKALRPPHGGKGNGRGHGH
jgi:hypothetical protein